MALPFEDKGNRLNCVHPKHVDTQPLFIQCLFVIVFFSFAFPIKLLLLVVLLWISFCKCFTLYRGNQSAVCHFKTRGVQVVCALRLRCIVYSKFSRWRRRSRNFAGYILYFSIDTVLSLDRFSRFHKLIFVQIFSVKKDKSIFFISI